MEQATAKLYIYIYLCCSKYPPFINVVPLKSVSVWNKAVYNIFHQTNTTYTFWLPSVTCLFMSIENIFQTILNFVVSLFIGMGYSAIYTPWKCLCKVENISYLCNVIITECIKTSQVYSIITQIAKFMGPTWRTPGSCRPQIGPMNLAIMVDFLKLIKGLTIHLLSINSVIVCCCHFSNAAIHLLLLIPNHKLWTVECTLWDLDVFWIEQKLANFMYVTYICMKMAH